MSYNAESLTKLKQLKNLAERISGIEEQVENLTAAGGEPNVITGVNVNGEAVTVTDKAVNITVPTKVSDITNDSDFQTGDQVAATVNAKIASVYKPAGTVAALSADLLVAANEGKVYNLSAEFTADENFADGTGETFPAGTDVAVINTDDGYKFNVMAGFVDLSGYQPKENGKVLSSNDFTNEEKAKLAGLKIATDEEFQEMLDEVFGTAQSA